MKLLDALKAQHIDRIYILNYIGDLSDWSAVKNYPYYKERLISELTDYYEIPKSFIYVEDNVRTVFTSLIMNNIKGEEFFNSWSLNIWEALLRIYKKADANNERNILVFYLGASILNDKNKLVRYIMNLPCRYDKVRLSFSISLDNYETQYGNIDTVPEFINNIYNRQDFFINAKEYDNPSFEGNMFIGQEAFIISTEGRRKSIDYIINNLFNLQNDDNYESFIEDFDFYIPTAQLATHIERYETIIEPTLYYCDILQVNRNDYLKGEYMDNV